MHARSVTRSCSTLFDPMVAHQGLLSMGFPGQEYWSELPFPFPGDLPDPGIKPMSPAWQADYLLLSYWESPVLVSSKLLKVQLNGKNQNFPDPYSGKTPSNAKI